MLQASLALLLALSSSSGVALPTRVDVGAGFSVKPPSGLEARLVEDSRDGRLDSMDLLTAALVASGVPDGRIEAEKDKAKAALAPAIARAKAVRDPRARGRALLAALHDTVLARYRAEASEIDAVVSTGEFNCLSSAVLFVVAAEGLLEAPRAMVTRRHAFARVDVGGRPVDVETTIRTGFDVDRAKIVTPEYIRRLGLDPDGTVTAAELLADLKSPEELPLTALVAGLYGNRGVGLVLQGDLQGAAAAYDRAARIATGKLKARVVEWRGALLNAAMVSLLKDGRVDDALALSRMALEGAEGESRRVLQKNVAAAYVLLGNRHLDRREWALAVAAYDEAVARGAKQADVVAARRRALAELAAKEGDLSRCGAEKARDERARRDAALCLADASRSMLDAGDASGALAVARRARRTADVDEAKAALFFALARRIDEDIKARSCASVEASAREAAPLRAAAKNERWSPQSAMGACWVEEAKAAHQAQRLDDAARAWVRALVHLPHEAAVRQNLARTLALRAQAHVEARRCDEARPLLVRAVRHEPELKTTSAQMLERCANLRASDLAARKAWAESAVELRRGLQDAPDSSVLKENLGGVLHNLAAALLKDGRCDEARALLADLDALGKHEAARAVRARCP